MKVGVSTLWLAALLQVASVVVPCVVLPTASEAVVGRPATPRSVAGVGRRTVRRTAVVRRPVAVAATGAAVAYTAMAVGTAVAQQPSGCQQVQVGGIGYLSCDGTWFQPQVQSGNVVYVVVAPPM